MRATELPFQVFEVWSNAGHSRSSITCSVSSNLSGALADHPMIRGLFDGPKYPNYFPTSTFALALMQLGYRFTPDVKGEPGTTSVKCRWSGDELLLLDSLRLAATSMGPLQSRVEKWFDLAMEQASGRFKRTATGIVLGISAVLVGVGDVDTIAIASNLYSGAQTHSATQYVLFWQDPQHWYRSIPGLIVTWAAVSLGAPFWFDMLNKLVNLRQTGLPPDEDKRQTQGAFTGSH